MSSWLWITIGSFAFIAIITSIIYLKFFKKNKKQWEESDYLSFRKFKKLNKNVISTKKIINSNEEGVSYALKKPFFKKNIQCGFLLASEKNNFKSNWLKLWSPAKYQKENQIKAFILPKSHIVVFGGTGSGKSDTYLIPNILLNSLTKDRPSGLVFDPKGEIYQKVAPFLLAQGYKVININLSSTANSDRWSPFQFAIDSAAEHIKYALLELVLVENSEVAQEIKAFKKTRISDAKTSINETATKLVKLSDSENSVWTNSASDILSIAGVSLLGFLISEAFDKLSKIKWIKNLKMTSQNFKKIKDKIFNSQEINEIIFNELKNLNAKNISNLIATTSPETWIVFLYHQEMKDKIGSFNSTKDQWKSFLMNIANALSFLGGDDFKDFINSSDFSYQDLIDHHTIIFINIPAAAEKRKAIPSLMVEQIWSFLNLKAQTFKNGSLPIPFLFYFEELANIPKIECYSQILTLGRGMNIFSFSIVQSLKQFEFIYGQGRITEVWGNTMAKIYLLGQDAETRKFIAEQYGERELIKDDGERIIKPLVSVEKLGNIKQGQCLVMMQRQNPIWLNAASSSSYKFFNDWERKIYGTKDKNEIQNIKFNLNKKYTKETDILILGNVIDNFMDKQMNNYQMIAIIALIKEILLSKFGDKLNNIKIDIMEQSVELYRKIIDKNGVFVKDKEVSINDLKFNPDEINNDEPIESSNESKIYNLFCNIIAQYVNNYLTAIQKIRKEEEIRKWNNRHGKNNNFTNTNIDDIKNEIEIGDNIKNEILCTFMYLKATQTNFPFALTQNEGLPYSIDGLVDNTLSSLVSKENFMVNGIIKILYKINFIDKFIKDAANQEDIEIKELKNIIDEQENKINNEIVQKISKENELILNEVNQNVSEPINNFKVQQIKDENNSSSIEEVKILVQEQQIINFENNNITINDKDKLFEENLLQILERRIIEYWCAKLIKPFNYDLNGFLKKIRLDNIITLEKLDEYHFSDKYLKVLKDVNRAYDKYLNLYKKQFNFSFSEYLKNVDINKIFPIIKRELNNWLEKIVNN